MTSNTIFFILFLRFFLEQTMHMHSWTALVAIPQISSVMSAGGGTGGSGVGVGWGCGECSGAVHPLWISTFMLRLAK